MFDLETTRHASKVILCKIGLLHDQKFLKAHVKCSVYDCILLCFLNLDLFFSTLAYVLLFWVVFISLDFVLSRAYCIVVMSLRVWRGAFTWLAAAVLEN